MANKLYNVRLIGKISSLTSVAGRKLLPAAVSCSQTQIAKLHSVLLQGQSYKRLYEPYDYVNKIYTGFHQLWEGTTKRFDENSKIIVVDGNIGTDKVSVAKKIAEEFDMLFLPDITQDEVFINKNGFDQRNFNVRLQKSDRFYDLTDLYKAKDPKEVYGFGRSQVEFYKKRLYRYLSALRHLFATGQGVVLERSMFSDRCFADAMRKCGYYTREGKAWYHENYNTSSTRMWKPHLVVYIDQSVSECKDLIAKRNNPIEKDSPLLTDKYLQAIEDSFKETLLPFHEKFGEVLTLDSDDLQYLDEIMYEMQLIKLDPPVVGDSYKFDDWYKEKEYMWNSERQMVDCDFNWENQFFDGLSPPFMADELFIQDQHNFNLVVMEHPSNAYLPGYMPSQQTFWQKLFDRPNIDALRH